MAAVLIGLVLALLSFLFDLPAAATAQHAPVLLAFCAACLASGAAYALIKH